MPRNPTFRRGVTQGRPACFWAAQGGVAPKLEKWQGVDNEYIYQWMMETIATCLCWTACVLLRRKVYMQAELSLIEDELGGVPLDHPLAKL